MELIFVYGSLLSGMGNWEYFLNNDHSVLLGKGQLKGNYKMISLGEFPGVIVDENCNNTIVGEVYAVSKNIVIAIDSLEGFVNDIDRNFYNKIEINTDYGKANMYVLNTTIRNYDHEYYEAVPDGDWRFFKRINI